MAVTSTRTRLRGLGLLRVGPHWAPGQVFPKLPPSWHPGLAQHRGPWWGDRPGRSFLWLLEESRSVGNMGAFL